MLQQQPQEEQMKKYYVHLALIATSSVIAYAVMLAFDLSQMLASGILGGVLLVAAVVTSGIYFFAGRNMSALSLGLSCAGVLLPVVWILGYYVLPSDNDTFIESLTIGRIAILVCILFVSSAAAGFIGYFGGNFGEAVGANFAEVGLASIITVSLLGSMLSLTQSWLLLLGLSLLIPPATWLAAKFCATVDGRRKI